MFDLALRHFKEKLYQPVVAIFARNFTPNQLTVAGFLCGLFCILLLWCQYYVLGQLFWWINRFFDGLDGVVARISKRQSDFGGYLDILAGKNSGASLYELFTFAAF